MRVNKLIGAQLDYWVAKAEKEVGLIRKDPERFVIIREDGTVAKYSPSTDWEQGGLIIHRESITVGRRVDGRNPWTAFIDRTFNRTGCLYIEGPTPLIAAMRAYVASKFGDTVPDDMGAM